MRSRQKASTISYRNKISQHLLSPAVDTITVEISVYFSVVITVFEAFLPTPPHMELARIVRMIGYSHFVEDEYRMFPHPAAGLFMLNDLPTRKKNWLKLTVERGSFLYQTDEIHCYTLFAVFSRGEKQYSFVKGRRQLVFFRRGIFIRPAHG